MGLFSEVVIAARRASLVLALVLASWLVQPAARATPAQVGGATAEGAGYAGSSGEAGPSGPPLATAQPANSLPGIDVSHYQDVINWTKVAASGQRFAIAKATEGTGYIDPMYATNRAGAMANGIVFGAYHFARPDLHPSNPEGEADHFVDTAQLGPGNIVPVLDLERQGTLSQTKLTAWILRWLDEVTARTGVRPMVYTSPNGWKNRTGDTPVVAEAGYTMLWVAHWGVSSPTVPAGDWAGNGWTFWQYGDCGHVAGIQGCVDVDWFGGLDFTPVTIPSPDTTAPVATIATPTGVSGPVTVSFSEIVRDVTRDNVVLRDLDTGQNLRVSTTCSNKAGREVGCATGKVITVVLDAGGPLLPGATYAAIVNPAEAPAQVVDRSGNPAPTAEQSFAPPTEVEQNSVAVGYDWESVTSPRAFGGSFDVERSAGATASFTFTGGPVTWYTFTGPVFGRASVVIDGHAKGTFDQYAPATHGKVARTFAGLGAGLHTIAIRVLGTKAPAATDTRVAVDGFRVGTGAVASEQDVDLSWGRVTLAAASGGSLAVSDLARATATFAFRGTGVVWSTRRGPDQGRAEVFVDGALVRTVDNFGTKALIDRRVGGLENGDHELRIVVLGTARPASTGTRVAIDRLTVLA